jgi:uncharacterized membrane protein YczE
MQTKKVFSSELAYLFGILILALGTAFMEKADFGMSMVVAPAYLIHLKISQTYSFYTFGMSEYVLQAFLLIVLSLVMRKFKKSYLFSFVTAVLYGFSLDLSMRIVAMGQFEGMAWRIVLFVIGLLLCAIGVSLFFHTYISPEAYELVVKEIASAYHLDINKVKTVYDCSSCLVGVILSFAFFGFGHFEGVKLGTIFCALVNGWLIGRISALFESLFVFKDAFPWREAFSR